MDRSEKSSPDVGQPQPTREAQIPEQLGNLDKNLAEMGEIIQRLYGRLESVRSPEPPEVAGEKPIVGLVPTAHTIRGLGELVDRYNTELSTLRDLLEN